MVYSVLEFMHDLFTFFLILLFCLSTYVNGTGFYASLALLFAFVIVIIIREQRVRKRLDFINQLKSHRRELRSGGTVVVDSLLLRYDTKVTTYFLSVGIVLSSINIPSIYRVYTSEGHAESLVYSFCSLISGWWAFPGGPITTIAFLKQNLTGGQVLSVSELIDQDLHRTIRYSGEIVIPSDEEEDIIEDRAVNTGDGSQSKKLAQKKRIKAPDGNFDEKIRDWEDPRPPGVKLAEKLRQEFDAVDVQGKFDNSTLSRSLKKLKERRKKGEDPEESE